MAFWGLEVTPKKSVPLTIERRLVVKQAALLIAKANPEPCVLSVSIDGNDQQFVVCRLHEGKLEHCTLELPFSPSDNATLHLKGPHTIHLTGFLDIGDEDDIQEMEDAAAIDGLDDVGMRQGQPAVMVRISGVLTDRTLVSPWLRQGSSR